MAISKDTLLNIGIGITSIVIVLLLCATVYRIFSVESIHFPQTKYESQNVSMYFMPQDEALVELWNQIDQANSSIHCAFRSLNYIPLEDALKEKESQGVTVRLLVYADYLSNTRIYEPYVTFTDPESEGMMHVNYCIIDDQLIITGSTIFNGNTLELNFHDLVLVQSKDLASQFDSHFWNLYGGHNRTRPYNHSAVTISDTSSVHALFCPLDDCVTAYVNLIDSANSTIHFAIYAFTEPAIKEAIIQAEKRGVKIIGVVDRFGLTPSSILYDDIPGVKLSQFNRRLHTKLLVIDSNISVTGSLNPSIRGTTLNDEAVLIFTDSTLASVYTEFVEYVYDFVKII